MTRYEKLQMLRQIRSNRELYCFYFLNGVEYLINPNTGELHRVRPGYFGGSHNLATAHLQDFIPGKIVDYPSVHLLPNRTELHFLKFLTNELICYQLNKCEYCFPSVG